MEKNENLWKKAEQSFVEAYDFADDVQKEKIVLSGVETKRLFNLLGMWISALKRMLEYASDVEMAKDYQNYSVKLQLQKSQFEKRYADALR